jgi:predicted ATPase
MEDKASDPTSRDSARAGGGDDYSLSLDTSRPVERSPSRAAGPESELSVPRDHLPGDAAPTPTAPTPPPAGIDSKMPRVRTFWVLALVYLLVWAGLMFLVLNHRFDRKMDWNTSYFSIAARNLVRDGFWNLRGGIYLSAGEKFDAGQREFYPGHPPMTAWLLAGWMKVLGPYAQRDWAIRALPLAFTVMNLLLLWVLVKRVFGAGTATVAMVLASMMPMVAFYSQNVNMEPFVLTFMLGASLGYLSWAQSGSKAGFVALCACVVLGCWTDWPMHIFAGLLGLAHAVRRRDGLGEAKKGGKARRPVLGSIALLVLPLLVFGVFVGYLKMNHSEPSELWGRATDRMTATSEGADKATVGGGYRLLASYFDWVEGGKPDFRRMSDFKVWFLDLFTPAALALGVLGAVFWRKWSGRLALVSGEAARRAMLRLMLCMVLTQAIYTLAFPQGAWKHEFWQYYLAVPVAVMGAGFLTWLTVAGGDRREFRFGLADRVGWAAAALIPIMAIGPMMWRLNFTVPGRPAGRHGEGLHFELIEPLKLHTKATDVILTDLPDAPPDDQTDGVQKPLPWYADRYIVADGMCAHLVVAGGGKVGEYGETTTERQAVEAIVKQLRGKRVIYLWEDEGGEELFRHLNETYPRYEIPVKGTAPMIVYLLQGEADQKWKKAGIVSGPGTRPVTTQPRWAKPLASLRACQCHPMPDGQRQLRRIVLTGGPGAGKTVISDRIAAMLPGRFVKVREAATQVYDHLQTRWDRLDVEGRREVQRRIYHLQRRQEEEMGRLFPDKVLLLDRGTIDGSAYWPEGPEDYWRDLGTTSAAELARYDAVVWLQTAAAIPGLYDGDGSNPCRFEQADAAIASGNLLRALWGGHPRMVEVGAYERLEEKVAAVADRLRAMTNDEVGNDE